MRAQLSSNERLAPGSRVVRQALALLGRDGEGRPVDRRVQSVLVPQQLPGLGDDLRRGAQRAGAQAVAQPVLGVAIERRRVKAHDARLEGGVHRRVGLGQRQRDAGWRQVGTERCAAEDYVVGAELPRL